jgi:phosphatidylinositol-3,4,5-trisphosphate 3-phosphatase/dual-specificity protein phosphatase PTEN
MAFIKRLVSKKKKRFQEDGFDLDLTYVTPRVIAMGFPSIKLEGIYRNNMADVQRFFESRHKGHYKVYNLCSERAYESWYFDGRVERFPFDDHNAPPFEIITPFCHSVDEWLKEHEKNVVIVHCKAGKGRTGVMICAYLIYSGEFKNAVESLDFYANSRTYDREGVTIPSQRRYVHYYGEYVSNGFAYPFPNQRIVLDAIIFHGIPKNVSSFVCKIKDKNGKEVISTRETPLQSGDKVIFKSCKGISLVDDVKFIFLEDKENKILVPVAKERDLFHFWLNCNFMSQQQCILKKSEIDRCNKDKRHKLYPKDFAIEISFIIADNVPEATDHCNCIRNSDFSSNEEDISSRDSDEFTDPDAILEEEFIQELEQEYRSLKVKK